jgi:hypothetical protein
MPGNAARAGFSGMNKVSLVYNSQAGMFEPQLSD